MSKLAVGVPWQQEMLPSHFLFDLFKTDVPKAVLPGGFLRGFKERIDHARNHIVQQAMEIGADEILFMDADQGFPPDVLARLRSHDKDIVSAVVPMRRRKPPHFFSVWKKTEDSDDVEKIRYAPASMGNSLVEVDAFGAGAMLVKMDVFRRIPFPWFLNTYDEETGTRTMGHDLRFCAMAQKYGYKLYADWSCRCTHDVMSMIDYEFVVESLRHQVVEDMKRRRLEQKVAVPERQIVLAR